jgi:hypothetical protein
MDQRHPTRKGSWRLDRIEATTPDRQEAAHRVARPEEIFSSDL